MQYNTKMVLQHFLLQYQKQLEASKTKELHSFLKRFLVKDELIKIIKWLMDDVALQHVALENSSYEELFGVIGDNETILSYFLETWETDSKNKEALTPSAVWDTLVQLSMETHYLGSKPLMDWDEYDHANYRALQLKSGRVKILWGIYDDSVTQDNMTEATPPNRFFDTYDQAIASINELVQDKEYKENELHVLQVFQSV